MSAPTVTVTTSRGPVQVVFDFDLLFSIEMTTGRTVADLLAEFASYTPDVTAGKEPTTKQLLAAARRFSIVQVGSFVAACLGIKPTELGNAITLKKLRDVFASLLPGFVAAINQLNGGEDGQEAGPTAAPHAASTS